MKQTKQMAKWISDLDASALTGERMLDIRYKLLDWLGCALGAASGRQAQALASVFEGERGTGSSSVFFDEGTYPLLTAAFLNGAQSHILECDDVHKSAITHPGIVAVTSSLTVSEAFDKTFGEFALGVIAAYEVMIRMGNALNPSHYDHWHTTGTCGAFAAAAAAARLLDENAEQTENALSMAATMASGLTYVFGTDAKLVTVGNAVSRGILAALLSRQGLVSRPGVIEAPGGYAEAVSAAPRLDALAGTGGYLIDTACYKMYASCGHTHSALDALFSLLTDAPFSADEVAGITVKVYSKAAELVGQFRRGTPSEAKFSLPYCIAVGILSGGVSVCQFEPEWLTSREVEALAERITVLADPSLDADYPITRPEELRVELKDGRCLTRRVELPNGKPPYSFIEDKFLLLAGRTLPAQTASAVRDLILGLQAGDCMREMITQLKGMLRIGKQHD